MVSIEDMSESEGAEPAGFGSLLFEQLRFLSVQNGKAKDGEAVVSILNAEDYLDNGIVKKDQAS